MSKRSVIIGFIGILLTATGIFMPVLDMGIEAINLWHPLLNAVAYGRLLTLLVLVLCLLCFLALVSRKKKPSMVVFLLSGTLVTIMGCILAYRVLPLEMDAYGLYMILASGLVLLVAGAMMALDKKRKV